MAYPESYLPGHMVAGGGRRDSKRTMTPDEFAGRCRGWVTGGVGIIGGCCGITVDHIARMAQAVPRKVG